MRRRVQKSAITDDWAACHIGAGCIYRNGNGHCASPRTNKGNSDAVCHRMSNGKLVRSLRELRPEQTPAGLALAAAMRAARD